MPEIITNHRDSMWSRELWETINDGGRWIIPRSGLVFQKDAALKRMTLIERMPWMEEMGGTAEDLRIYQDADLHAVAKRFALIGIDVTDRKEAT